MNSNFIKAIQEANTVLLNIPECVDLTVERGSYRWTINSAATNKARKELRKILHELWQSGAYNYEQIARGLRVGSEVIQALIDEQFIESKGL